MTCARELRRRPSNILGRVCVSGEHRGSFLPRAAGWPKESTSGADPMLTEREIKRGGRLIISLWGGLCGGLTADGGHLIQYRRRQEISFAGDQVDDHSTASAGNLRASLVDFLLWSGVKGHYCTSVVDARLISFTVWWNPSRNVWSQIWRNPVPSQRGSNL
ncbi:hypothetical protein GGI42DRAFT_69955 [Trichoderma sp. SZMC 28013]